MIMRTLAPRAGRQRRLQVQPAGLGEEQRLGHALHGDYHQYLIDQLCQLARAVTAGDFLLPGAQARDMYRPALNARTAADRTTISPGP